MRVLIADDEPMLRDIMRELVAMRGHEVLLAVDGKEAFEIFQKEKPDLVISDIVMPRMDGLKFLSEIRQLDQDTLVVMTTGLGKEEFTLEALRLRANDFIKKPIEPSVLFPLLDKYAGIVESRTRLTETLSFCTRRSSTMKIGNRMELIPMIAQRLIIETCEMIPHDQRLGLKIALVELLANAIEHGNLNITCQEKQAAMEESLDGIDKLREERLRKEEFAQRNVTIEFTMDQESCEWIITDEGLGFDFNTLPNPLDPENLTQPNGRGIFLARLNFEQLEFIGKGNTVRVRKVFPRDQKMRNGGQKKA
ncbi:MAG TPA: response regulator [Candidatus Ozemobacteraceae bacterium]|nr:response regulator [Candidatus Ozemobacteraceae bacterium]